MSWNRQYGNARTGNAQSQFCGGQKMFEVGDVVRLKSGSPKMIVSIVELSDHLITVTWVSYASAIPYSYTGDCRLFEYA